MDTARPSAPERDGGAPFAESETSEGVVPPQTPYEGPPGVLLRINLNDGKTFTRANDRELLTDGLVVVEFVNNGESDLTFFPGELGCFRTDLHIVGINDDDRYHGPGTIGRGRIRLRPGDVTRVRFDFRKRGHYAHFGNSTAKLWGLKDGCYDAVLRVTGREVRGIRLCYTGEENASSVAPDLDSHLKCNPINGSPFASSSQGEIENPNESSPVPKDEQISAGARAGRTALASAAKSCAYYSVEHLLNKKEEIDRDRLNAALAAAVGEGCALVVDLLLERGADPSSPECAVAMIEAAGLGKINTFKRLARAGADLNRPAPSQNRGCSSRFRKPFKLNSGDAPPSSSSWAPCCPSPKSTRSCYPKNGRTASPLASSPTTRRSRRSSARSEPAWPKASRENP